MPFLGNVHLLLTQTHSTEVQQHHRVPVVGFRSGLVVHALLYAHGSALDALQAKQHAGNLTTGQLTSQCLFLWKHFNFFLRPTSRSSFLADLHTVYSL